MVGEGCEGKRRVGGEGGRGMWSGTKESEEGARSIEVQTCLGVSSSSRGLGEFDPPGMLIELPNRSLSFWSKRLERGEKEAKITSVPPPSLFTSDLFRFQKLRSSSNHSTNDPTLYRIRNSPKKGIKVF